MNEITIEGNAKSKDIAEIKLHKHTMFSTGVYTL